MPTAKLSLDNLHLLSDGKVAEAVKRHLKSVAADCYDRPGEQKARSVKLELKVKPVIDDAGICEEVAVEAEISSAIPKHVSRPVSMQIERNSQLRFEYGSEEEEEAESES